MNRKEQTGEDRSTSGKLSKGYPKYKVARPEGQVQATGKRQGRSVIGRSYPVA